MDIIASFVEREARKTRVYAKFTTVQPRKLRGFSAERNWFPLRYII